MKKAKYQFFDTLSNEELHLLESDCVARGIQHPIEVDTEGNVLDGHNRLAIAEKHDLEYQEICRDDLETEEAKQAHVLMINMARRQLKPHQWGAAFKKILELRGVKRGRGARNDQPQEGRPTSATVAQVAEELGVPERTAKRRLEEADSYEQLPPEEKKAVDSGKKSVSSAVRKLKQATKREEASKTAKITGKYSVIYADPPWQYGASIVTGGADQHYSTMSTDDVCNIPVKDHVTKDAVLFLWVTNPLIPDGLDVVDAWGFSYKTCIVWVKDKATSGIGKYVRGKHELLFIATRGTMIPDSSSRPESVIIAERSQHSRKPECAYEMIERMYPDQNYLELFSRIKRDGWKAWGAEVP